MPWEYLRTPVFDVRAERVAAAIGDVRGKTIVDLNCGHASLFRFLPRTYSMYLGNDIVREHLPRSTGTSAFYNVMDAIMPGLVRGSGLTIDVLVVMGYYDFKSGPNKHESATLDDTIRTLLAMGVGRVAIECSRKSLPGVHRLPRDLRVAPFDIPWTGDPAMKWVSARALCTDEVGS